MFKVAILGCFGAFQGFLGGGGLEHFRVAFWSIVTFGGIFWCVSGWHFGAFQGILELWDLLGGILGCSRAAF